METIFPNPLASKTEKMSDNYLNQACDYAVRNRTDNSQRIKKLDVLFASYLGIKHSKDLEFINKIYSKTAKVKYVDYRAQKAILDRVWGEWLKGDLVGTVRSTNPSSKVRKWDKENFKRGVYEAREQINTLKEKGGFDVLPGVDVPEKLEGDEYLKYLSVKEQNEVVIQQLLDEFKETLGIKDQFARELLHIIIGAESFGKTYLNKSGELTHESFDPRFALYEEIDGDYYLEKSPYLGTHRPMFVHDIISEYNLTNAQMTRLKNVNLENASSHDLATKGGRNYYENIDNNLAFYVTDMEFYAWEPIRTKRSKGKNGEKHENDLSEEYYEKNKKKIKREIKRGKYKMETRWKKVVWKVVRVGADMIVDKGPVEYAMGSLNDPNYAEMHFGGCLFNSIDRVRVSLLEMTNSLSNTINVAQTQIVREISKIKGKVLVYDMAGLPVKKKLSDILTEAVNDGIVTLNSSADGNQSRRDLPDALNMLKEIDLGATQTLETLLRVKQDMFEMLKQVTGQNDQRSGNTPASQTATSAMSDLEKSENVTAPMFYFFTNRLNRIFKKAAELSKVQASYIKPEKIEGIVGTSAFKEFVENLPLLEDDYEFFITDSKKDMQLREEVKRVLEAQSNRGELRGEDYIAFIMSKNLTEGQAKLRAAWKEIKEVAQKEADAQRQADSQNITKQIDDRIKEREDMQAARLDEIREKGKEDRKTKAMVAETDYIKERAKTEDDMMMESASEGGMPPSPPQQQMEQPIN